LSNVCEECKAVDECTQECECADCLDAHECDCMCDDCVDRRADSMEALNDLD